MEQEYIIDNQGKKRKATRVLCEQCGKSFLKPTRFLAEHNYCSKQCTFDSRKQRVELKCDLCGKMYEIVQSGLNRSRSGLHFCSRQCKDEAQKIKNGFVKMHPSHYGKTIWGDYVPGNIYQRICFEKHPHRCCVCGEEKIVAVHHYDGNHNNNDVCNLVPLCPTHHNYWHSRFRYLIKDKVDEYVKNFINKFNGL